MLMITLRLANASIFQVADWIIGWTQLMEQNHRHEEFVPYTPDFRTRSFGPVTDPHGYDPTVIRIGIARPGDLEPPRPTRYSIKRDNQIMEFLLVQQPETDVSLSIAWYDWLEERYTPWTLGYLREYLRLIGQTWPEGCDQLREQLGSFDKISIADICESPARLAPSNQTPGAGYNRVLLRNPKQELAAGEPAQTLPPGQPSTESSVPDASSGAATPENRAHFGDKRRRRADLVKQLKASHPYSSYADIAVRAEKLARERIEEELGDSRPSDASERKKAIRDQMNRQYGQVIFSAEDVRNDWRDMSKSGEVGPWIKGSRGP